MTETSKHLVWIINILRNFRSISIFLSMYIATLSMPRQSPPTNTRGMAKCSTTSFQNESTPVPWMSVTENLAALAGPSRLPISTGWDRVSKTACHRFITSNRCALWASFKAFDRRLLDLFPAERADVAGMMTQSYSRLFAVAIRLALRAQRVMVNQNSRQSVLSYYL
jgi:hypothetical protein